MMVTAIAFDFGARSIGVAYGQSLTGTGRELPPLKARDGVPDWRAVATLLAEWRPRQLVVGLPLSMEGDDQEMTARAQRFGRQLEGRFGINTDMVDERLTTREAWQVAIDSGEYHSKPEIDSLAAVLITESWLRNRPKDSA